MFYLFIYFLFQSWDLQDASADQRKILHSGKYWAEFYNIKGRLHQLILSMYLVKYHLNLSGQLWPLIFKWRLSRLACLNECIFC